MKRNHIISTLLLIAALQLCIVLGGCGGAEKREELYPNGKIKLRYSVKEIDGNFLKHGVYSTWYPDGTKQEEMEYEKGKKHGRYLSWHENGVKFQEIEYENDEKSGDNNWWYDNGAKGGEEQYLNGIRDGKSLSWHPDGRKKSIANYSRGTLDGEVVILDDQNACRASFKDGLLHGKLEAHYAEDACGFEINVMASFENGVPVEEFSISQKNDCDNSAFSIEGRFTQRSAIRLDKVLNITFDEGRLFVGNLLWHNDFNDFFYSWQGIGGLWDNYHFGTGFFTDLLPKLKDCIAESEK